MKKSILIIEDQSDIAETLEEAFDMEFQPDGYEFDVSVANSPEEVVDNGWDLESFDVYLVDLRLREGDAGPSRVFGNQLLAVQAFEDHGSLRIVYSGNFTLPYVVSAFRHGATDFISKVETEPGQVPKRVREALDAVERRKKRCVELEKTLIRNAVEWQRRFGGHFVAVVGENVVADGPSRLAALIAYQNARDTSDELPDVPDVLFVESSGEHS